MYVFAPKPSPSFNKRSIAAIRLVFLFMASLYLSGCLDLSSGFHSENSADSEDQKQNPETPGEDSPDSNQETLFAQANVVLENRCNSCHRTGGSAGFAPFKGLAQGDFIDQGLITPGEPLSSVLLQRTIYGSGSPSNMPPSRNFEKAEYEILVAWINSTGEEQTQPTPAPTPIVDTNPTPVPSPTPIAMPNPTPTPPTPTPNPNIEPPNFAKVQEILGNNCVSCHQSGGRAGLWPIDFTTEQEFISEGWVTAGNIDDSKLINRLIFYKGSNSTNTNMPAGGDQALFTQMDYDLLAAWVKNLTNTPKPTPTPVANPNPTPTPPNTNTPELFACKDTMETSESLSYSLSKKQYINSLRVIFGDDIVNQLKAELSTIPEDQFSHYEHRRLTSMTKDSIESYLNVSNKIAALVSADSDRLKEIFPCETSETGATVNPAGLIFSNQPGTLSGAAVLDHNNSLLVTQGTIEMYFQLDSVSGRVGLFSKDHTGYGNGGHISVYIDNGVLKSRLQSTNSDSELSYASLSAGTPYHLTISFGALGNQMYLNGSLVDSTNYTGGLIGNTEKVVIGALQWASQAGQTDKIQNPASGVINYVKIYDNQLQANIISALAQQIPNLEDINSNGTYCLDGYLDGLAEQIFRRTLSQEEKEFAHSFSQSMGRLEDGLTTVLSYHLQSPFFLMRLELGNEEDDLSEYELSPYEIANRISFLATDAGPDKELLMVAKNKSILDMEVRKSQARRLLRSPLGKEKLQETLMGWSKMGYVEPIENLPNDLIMGINSSSLKTSMIEETREFLNYILFEANGNFEDLLTSKASFAKDADLANLDGHSPATNSTQELQGRRQGLLMRAPAFTSGFSRSRIILRGVEFQGNVLCNELPSPPDDIVIKRDDEVLTAEELLNTTNKAHIAKLTESKDCMTCHSLINPTGFAFENIGSFGELREREKVYTKEGQFHKDLDIDTYAMVPTWQGQKVEVEDGYDLVSHVASEAQGKACFAKKMFRYAYEKRESIEDNCQINSMYQILNNSDGNIVEAFVNLIASPANTKKKR